MHRIGRWLGELGARTLFIEPGSLSENGYIESFNLGSPLAIAGTFGLAQNLVQGMGQVMCKIMGGSF